jgi:hypothetical protein
MQGGAVMSTAQQSIHSTVELAALEFEPVSEFREISCIKDARYSASLSSTATAIKIALRIIGKSKPEMIAMVQDLGHVTAEETVDHLVEAREMLTSYLETVEAAEIRMVVALANCAAEGA